MPFVAAGAGLCLLSLTADQQVVTAAGEGWPGRPNRSTEPPRYRTICRVDLEKLNAPERALREAFARGDLVDLTRARSVRGRTVRAEVIAALLLGAVPPEPGRVAAVRLHGSRVAGTLALAHATITGPAELAGPGGAARQPARRRRRPAGAAGHRRRRVPAGRGRGRRHHRAGRRRPPAPGGPGTERLQADGGGRVPGPVRLQRGGEVALTDALARERERRALLPWYSRAWSWLQEITVGYGYRPLRATGWLAVFLLLGALVFGLHHPPPLPGTPHPAFNSFIYTVDLLVPLISLGLRSSYDPQCRALAGLPAHRGRLDLRHHHRGRDTPGAAPPVARRSPGRGRRRLRRPYAGPGARRPAPARTGRWRPRRCARTPAAAGRSSSRGRRGRWPAPRRGP